MLFMIGLWTFLRALLSGSVAIALESPSRTTCRITLRKPRTDALNGEVCGGSIGIRTPLYGEFPRGSAVTSMRPGPARCETSHRAPRESALRPPNKRPLPSATIASG